MALNVGLIFRVKRFDGSKIPDYERWYGLIAYGIPAMVPIAYLIHDQLSSHSIVGSAIVSLVNVEAANDADKRHSYGAGCAKTSIGCALPSSMRPCGRDLLVHDASLR
jgi:hypothetical protein